MDAKEMVRALVALHRFAQAVQGPESSAGCWQCGRIAEAFLPLLNNFMPGQWSIVRGQFNGDPHVWMEHVAGFFFDPTVDQFGGVFTILSDSLDQRYSKDQ